MINVPLSDVCVCVCVPFTSLSHCHCLISILSTREYGRMEILQLFKPNHHLRPLFPQSALNKHAMYTHPEVESNVRAYLDAHQLWGSTPAGNIETDECLQSLKLPMVTEWSELLESVFENMQQFCSVLRTSSSYPSLSLSLYKYLCIHAYSWCVRITTTDGEQTQFAPQKGAAPPPIQIKIANRQGGRKHVTLVTGFCSFCFFLCV